MSFPRTLLVIALVSALAAGCGWQLRGAGSSAALDDRLIYVDSRVRSEAGAAAARGLRLAGARTAESAAGAEAVLVLVHEEQGRRAVSVSDRARVQEYELNYRLSYRLETPDGEVLLPEQSVTVSQVYRYDRDNVLGSESQEAVIAERLRQDAVRLLLPRVQAALRQDGE